MKLGYLQPGSEPKFSAGRLLQERFASQILELRERADALAWVAARIPPDGDIPQHAEMIFLQAINSPYGYSGVAQSSGPYPPARGSRY